MKNHTIIWLVSKKSECDPEIPQSQIADKPMASQGRATKRIGQDKQSKATSSLYQDVCKTRKDTKYAQQNIEHLQTPKMGAPIKANQQQQSHHLRTDRRLSHWGLKCI